MYERNEKLPLWITRLIWALIAVALLAGLVRALSAQTPILRRAADGFGEHEVDGMEVDDTDTTFTLKSGKGFQVEEGGKLNIDGVISIPDMDDNLDADFTTMAGESTPDGTELVWVQRTDGTWRRVAIGDWPTTISNNPPNNDIGFVGVSAYHDTNVALPDDTLTTISLNSEVYDFGDIHSVSSETEKLVAPITGSYSVSATAAFVSNSTGFRELRLSFQGERTIASQKDEAVTGSGTNVNVSTTIFLQAGEWISVQAWQTSGGPLNFLSVDTWAPSAQMTLWLDVTEPTTTKGDISTHNGTDADRLAVGTDRQTLHSDPSTTTGLAWDLVNMNTDIDGHQLPFDLDGTGADTGATASGTQASNSPGDLAWDTPSNAASSNDVYTFVQFLGANDVTEHLDVSNFNFNLPVGATVKGIIARVERKSTQADRTEDETVSLLVGGVETGSNLAIGDGVYNTGDEWGTSDTVIVYGSSDDVFGDWGIIPTRDEVNASDFGLRFAVTTIDNGTTSITVDFISLQVYYETLGGEWHVAISSTDGKLKAGLGPKEAIDLDPSMEFNFDRSVNFPNWIGVEQDDPQRPLHISRAIGSGLRLDDTTTTDGMELTQINDGVWGWSGLSGDMEFRVQNAHFYVVDARMQAERFKADGLTGATAASRWVGATTGGAPASGTFEIGDFVIDNGNGRVYVCTVAGSPGTWVRAGDGVGAGGGSGESAINTRATHDATIDFANDLLAAFDDSQTTNTQLGMDDFVEQIPYTAARVYNSANISIPHNTATILTFNSERYDSDALHDTGTNTSRLTIPEDGVYSITGNIFWDSGTTGIRVFSIKVDGTTIIGRDFDGPDQRAQQVTTEWEFTAGQYVELELYQNEGSSINVQASSSLSPEFMIHKVR